MGQVYHETGGYKSELAQDYCNIFGMSNHVTGYGKKTESGFMRYDDYGKSIDDYFALITDYKNRSQTTPPETFIGYATWLKENGYYTDTINNYANGMVYGWNTTKLLLNITL